MKLSMVRRMLWMAILAMVVSLTAAPAMAKVKTLLPEKFQVASGSDTWIKGPLGIREGVFWVPLKLPVGSRITKVVFYHWGNDSDSRINMLWLYRTKVGYASPPEDILMFGISNDYTGADFNVEPLAVEITSAYMPGSDLVIRAGYRYFVQVVCIGAVVPGVKVYYESP